MDAIWVCLCHPNKGKKTNKDVARIFLRRFFVSKICFFEKKLLQSIKKVCKVWERDFYLKGGLYAEFC